MMSTNQIGHGSLYALALDSSITIHLCSISTQMYVYTLLLEDTVITCQKDWQAVQDANLSSSLRCSSKHSIAELILRNHLRATEGKKDAALLNTLQALYVQAGIALQRIAQSRTVLGKSRRVKNNQIILLVMFIKILEGIFADSLMACIFREIERNILIGQFYRLGTAVYGVNSLSLASHRINRKTAGIAEHVEHALTLGIMLEQRTVLTLIYEETRFLTTQPVDMEFQSILYSNIVSITSQYKAIFLSEVSLIW